MMVVERAARLRHEVATRVSRPGEMPARRTNDDSPRPAPVGGCGVWSDGRTTQWKESPQAQEPVAFGLSMVKPCFSMLSTKSIIAPLR